MSVTRKLSSTVEDKGGEDEGIVGGGGGIGDSSRKESIGLPIPSPSSSLFSQKHPVGTMLSTEELYRGRTDVFIPEEMVPMEFAKILFESKFPLRNLLEIADSSSPHSFPAGTELGSAADSWSIMALILQCHCRQMEQDPPSQLLTPEEKLTGKIGGKI